MKTNKNVVETNNQMDDANTLQKKARRKTMWIVGIILVCIIIVGGIIWIAT
jgi:t-SNARE complex subunit (syntaxin)